MHVEAFHSNGELRFHSLNTRSVMPQLRAENVSEYISDADAFNIAETTRLNAAKTAALIAALPRFSAKFLERQSKIVEQPHKPEASSSFYTWRRGHNATNQSRQAFKSHTGKQTKKTSLAEMNSAVAIAAKAAAKRIRQAKNALKNEEEASRRAITMIRVNNQRASIFKAVALEAVAETVEEVVEIEIEKELTESEIRANEYRVFKENEFKAFRSQECSISYDIVEPKTVKVDYNSWKVVKKVSSKKVRIADAIIKSLYSNTAPIAITATTFEKKPMKKVSATLLCKSVSSGKKCPYKAGTCNFAHNADELKPRKCLNVRCKFVKTCSDKFVNHGKKVCSFIHEGESKGNLCSRLGIKPSKTKPISDKALKSSKPVMWATSMSTKVMKRYSKQFAWKPLKKCKSGVCIS